MNKRVLSALIAVMLLASSIGPVYAAQSDWVSPIEIRNTGKGIVFGSGSNKITVEVDLEYSQGQDTRVVKWNPVKSSKNRQSSSRTENMKADGFELDFYVKRYENQVKFDLYASRDLAVWLTVDGDYQGNYIFTSGRTTLNLFDVFVYADNFYFDEETQRFSFTMESGERIDPLVSFNEVAGTYVYDSSVDFAPAVVLPNTYSGNVSLHGAELYAQEGQQLKDYQLITGSNFTVVDSDTVSFEWIIENLREETSPHLTDGQTNGPETVSWDDNPTFWTRLVVNAGGDFNVTPSIDLVNFVKGNSSILNNVTETAPGAGWDFVGITHVYPVAVDWSESNFICFWMDGNNTGDTFNLAINTPDIGNRGIWDVIDNFSGWRRVVLPLNDPDLLQGDYDKSNVKEVRIIHANPSRAAFTRFDRVVVDDAIWVPSEFYIGDNVTDITVYGLDSTGADPRPVFEWTTNGTTEGDIYPGNMRNLEDEWLGSIAKNNATDWTLKANTTLPAGTLGQYLINTTVLGSFNRLCLPADFVTNDINWFNPELSIERGTPWNFAGLAQDPAAAPRGNGVGALSLISGANVKIHNTQFPTAAGNGALEVSNNDRANWEINTTAKTYQYEFWLDNGNAAAQNATIETRILDLPSIATYTLSYWNGTAFVEFMDFASGNITQPKSINQTSLDAAMYLEGLRTETKAIVNATAGLADIGPITYGSNYGVRNIFGFTIELLGDDGVPADGADRILLRFTMTYVNDGDVTYEFNRDTNQYWGIDNLDNSAIEFYDGLTASPSLYGVLVTAQRPDALFVTSGADQEISAIQFNVSGNFVVLTDNADGTETTTAPTGETIQLTADRWQYYKNFAQFDRGQRAVVDGSGEGDSGFAWNYTSFAGLDQKAAFKVPLAPWDNATTKDGTNGRDHARFRAIVNMATPSTYSYTADFAAPPQFQFVSSLFIDYQRDSYNLRPRAPGKSTTFTFTDPRTDTPYSITYVPGAGGPNARQDIQAMSVNGGNLQSKVILQGTVTAGAGPTQNITVTLGNTIAPMVHSVSGGNLTAVTWNPGQRILTARVDGSAGQQIVVDTGDRGRPTSVTGITARSFDPATGLITLTLGDGVRTAVLTWESPTQGLRSSASNLTQVLTLILILVAVSWLELRRRGVDPRVTYGLIVAIAIIMIVALLAQRIGL